MSAVSYIALSLADMNDLLRRAAERPEMVSARTAAQMFDMTFMTIDSMVKEKRLTRYVVPGHSKLVRYKVTELANLFKPLP